MNEVSPRHRLRSVATTLAVALTLTLAAAAGCDSRREPPLPSVLDKLRESHIDGQPKIKIGVATTEPLMGELRNGTYTGFDVEIARYIAASLGFAGDQRIEWVPLATEDRIPALQGGTVDLVVSSFSITEERKKLVSFAGPYFVTTQEVMVPEAAVLAMLVWAALPVISTPVLPLTVTTIESAPGASEDVRGHVVTVDDVNVVLLQERGGVRYVPVDQIRAQVLCASEEELPRRRLRIRDFHVEDSLLEGLGRRARPVHRIDAACRTVNLGYGG